MADIEMTQVDGTAAHKYSMKKIDNATGLPMGEVKPLQVDVMSTQPSTKITLNGNTTMFRGTADLTINGQVKWNDVPIHVTILNGNILNLNLDPGKTEDHFKGLPVFGSVKSIIDNNGKELLTKYGQSPLHSLFFLSFLRSFLIINTIDITFKQPFDCTKL